MRPQDHQVRGRLVGDGQDLGARESAAHHAGRAFQRGNPGEEVRQLHLGEGPLACGHLRALHLQVGKLHDTGRNSGAPGSARAAASRTASGSTLAECSDMSVGSSTRRAARPSGSCITSTGTRAARRTRGKVVPSTAPDIPDRRAAPSTSRSARASAA